jgi:hypothetical protein
MTRPDPKPVDVIDDWFKARCDGLWENQNGLRLETTDNPGWLLTIDEAIEEPTFQKLAAEARKRWGAECIREHDKPKVYGVSLKPLPIQIIRLKKDKITIYAASLGDCLCVAAYILAALRPQN